MPARGHLEWLEITDFTAGLHTRPNALKVFGTPPSAAQQMDDCVALPEGGLRAFYAPTAVSTSGLVATSGESVMGAGLRSGIALRSGASGDGTDRYIATFRASDLKTRLYRMDGSNGETTWKQKDATYTLAASSRNGTRAASFVPFIDSSGNAWMIMVIRNAGVGGTYKIAYVAGAGPPAGDGVLTNLNAATGPVCVNQARIIVGDGGATVPYRLYYGDPGLTTGAITTLANYLDIAPYQDGAGLCIVAPQEPSDLVIGREGAPWVEINGDISASGTPVRELGAVHTGAFTEQDPARTPGGLAVIEPGGGIYLTDGRTFQLISEQLEAFYKIDSTLTDHVNVGKMAFLNQYLFAPQGYVFDFVSRSWFRLSDMPNAAFWVADARRQKMWGISGGGSHTQMDYVPFDQQSGDPSSTGVNRKHTYTWRSAHLTRPDGHDSRIREVQLFVRPSAVCDITVLVTDANGNQRGRTITGVTAVPQLLSFQFSNIGSEYQDVTIVPVAQNTSNEAPIIERVRIGFAPGHQRY